MPDASSFDSWYGAEHPRLFVSMLALTGDRDVALDATDEALSRALQHWPRVGAMASPGGWTYRVAVNVARRRLRRRTLERRLLRRLATARVSPAPAGEVWELVRALPERQRLAVVLRFVADLTEVEIAEVMHITRGTVASTLSAARRSLGSALGEPDSAERS